MYGYLYILDVPHPQNNHALNVHNNTGLKTHLIHSPKPAFLLVLALILLDFVRQLGYLVEGHMPFRHL